MDMYWRPGVCLVLQLLLIHVYSLDPLAEARVLLRAQCKAKCLHLLTQSSDSVIRQTLKRIESTDSTVGECFGPDREHCSDACFSACDSPPQTCLSECLASETVSSGCQLGCLLLEECSYARPGTCPTKMRSVPQHEGPEGGEEAVDAEQKDVDADDVDEDATATGRPQLSHFTRPAGQSLRQACLKECHSDTSCPILHQKCCHYGCNSVCSEPVYNENVPPLPPPLQLISIPDRPGAMALGWAGNYTDFLRLHGSVVFVLQTRFCACKYFDPAHVSPWQTLIMASNLGATLNAFDPGQIYEFRVAAVGIHGSRGFGSGSKPFPARPTRPRPPSSPQNITESTWRLHPSGQVSVQLNWLAPKHTDLPLSGYVVSWMVDNTHVQGDGQPKDTNSYFSKTLPPDILSLTVENLLPNLSYKVQVTATSYWYGEGQLRSQPNIIFVSTHSLNPYASSDESHRQRSLGTVVPMDANTSTEDRCKCSAMNAVDDRLEIGTPEIFQGDLTATVLFKSFPHTDNGVYQIEWFPQVCIDSHESTDSIASGMLTATVRSHYFRLTKLKFNCVYIVRLVALNAGDRGPRRLEDNPPEIVTACFCTGSCKKTKRTLLSGASECPDTEPMTLLPPRNIQVELHDRRRLDYRVTWLPPAPSLNAVQDDALTRYRVMWAPRQEEPVDATTYNDKAGFSPILDTARSDVRVVEKNQTWIILPRLRPKTFYILRIQTIGSIGRDREKESTPVVHYFMTHDAFQTDRRISPQRFPARQTSSSGGWQLPHLLCSVLLLTLNSFQRYT